MVLPGFLLHDKPRFYIFSSDGFISLRIIWVVNCLKSHPQTWGHQTCRVSSGQPLNYLNQKQTQWAKPKLKCAAVAPLTLCHLESTLAAFCSCFNGSLCSPVLPGLLTLLRSKSQMTAASKKQELSSKPPARLFQSCNHQFQSNT